MKNNILVKIVDMTYDYANNLFNMKIKEKDSGKEKTLAIRGDDFDFIKDSSNKLYYFDKEIPVSIADFFCKEFIGKDKNLFVEVDKTSIKDVKKEGKKSSQEDMDKINENMSQYPIEEVVNQMMRDNEKLNNES